MGEGAPARQAISLRDPATLALSQSFAKLADALAVAAARERRCYVG